MSTYSSLGFQNACSPLMEELIFFHDHLMTILILITMIISYSMVSTTTNNILNKIMLESQPLELFWTITPTFILIFIGMPSIRLLYLLDEVFNPMMTIKIMGHQWYWSYEYSDFLNVEFDSFMTQLTPSSEMNMLRLLDVDNRMTLPFNTQIRALISAADVLHSWTIPSLGIKTDAVPGRLNQLNFLTTRPGLFYGQCSEICGANHSFMPIVIESTSPSFFLTWIKNNSS
uniref:Cytochrome c oxidase subunit 2 n=1 Tax=Friesea antarctica TaxID=2720488 RepID=B2BSE0_9HEXA|nr:cytochrome c oxidase subunit II [Friesea antarctica]ABS57593.1 cytochrome c oxidase subunit II [Friesea antarctica]